MSDRTEQQVVAEKKPYVTPEVTEHGTVEQLTQVALIGSGPSKVAE